MACNNQHKSQPDNRHLYRACQSHHNPDDDQQKPGHQQGDAQTLVSPLTTLVSPLTTLVSPLITLVSPSIAFAYDHYLSNAWLPST